MGRKMGVRGRPGLFFLIILVIFLAIFFLTWKSMMSPKGKVDVKDVYSMNFQHVKHNTNSQHQPHSDLNDVWHRAKLLNGEKQDDLENEKDEDYHHLTNSVKLDPVVSDMNKAKVKSPLSSLLHATHQPVVKQLDSKPYYHKLDESMKIIGGRMERLVHLDLKGAAPKLSYFKELFPLFSRLGATGLLIEYEDMFPYSGKLQLLSAENSYTKDQIAELLYLAKLNSLTVIPLIQTFGHMEFVLKSLELKGLRESEYTPQVIDITSNTSYQLIHEMVSQVLNSHPAITYFHIGCDEVYEIGRGKSADVIVRERVTTEKLFLRHVKRVASIVAELSKNKVRPIIWDDELRKMADEDIKTAGLPSVVDIMVWRYVSNISDVLTEAVWKKYAQLFKTVWAASSFKGATGPRQVYTEPQYHIINHFSWMDAIAKYGRNVSFKGIALTGWQRFDHFATLCELLPVAIPSLAVCLATIRNGGFDEGVHKITSGLLGCSNLIEMSFPELDKKERLARISQDCSFPGNLVYYGVQQLWGYKQFQEIDRRSGWLSDYQIDHGFTSPGQLKVLSMRLFDLNSKLIQIREPLEVNLNKIYSTDTVQEWLEENVFEMQRELKRLQEKIKTASENTHWARRPNIPLLTAKRASVPVAPGTTVMVPKNELDDQKVHHPVQLDNTKEGGQPQLNNRLSNNINNLERKISQDRLSRIRVPQPVSVKSTPSFNQRRDVNTNEVLKNSQKRLATFQEVKHQNGNAFSNGQDFNSYNRQHDAYADNLLKNTPLKKESVQHIKPQNDNIFLNRVNNLQDGRNQNKGVSNEERLVHNPFLSDLNQKQNSLNADGSLPKNGAKIKDPQISSNMLHRHSDVINSHNNQQDHLNGMGHKENIDKPVESNVNLHKVVGSDNARDPTALKMNQDNGRKNEGTLNQFGDRRRIPTPHQESLSGKFEINDLDKHRYNIRDKNGNDVLNNEKIKLSEKAEDIFSQNRNSVVERNDILKKATNNILERNNNDIFEQDDKKDNEFNMFRNNGEHILDNDVNHVVKDIGRNEQKNILDVHNQRNNVISMENDLKKIYDDQDDKDELDTK